MINKDSTIPALPVCAVARSFNRQKGGSRGNSDGKSGSFLVGRRSLVSKRQPPAVPQMAT